jgi:hypothetical protein
MSSIPKWSLGFLWAGVIEGALIFAWPMLASGPFPIPNGRDFTAWPFDRVVWTLSLCTAVWLSLPGWHTKDRLRYSAWAIAALAVVALWNAGFLGYPLIWTVWDIRAVTRPPLATPSDEPVTCLACDATIAPGASVCRKCGWSFERS